MGQWRTSCPTRLCYPVGWRLRELQLPLSELQLAFGHSVAQHSETLLDRLSPELRAYIQAYFRTMAQVSGLSFLTRVTIIKIHPPPAFRLA